MNFEWKLFGMTMNDCISLSNSMKMKTVAKTLRTIKIQSSGIDDDRARLIAAALVDNEVLYKLGTQKELSGADS